MAVAKRRLIDAARRRRSSADAAGHVRLLAEELDRCGGHRRSPTIASA